MKSVFAVNGDEVNICLSICLFIYIYIRIVSGIQQVLYMFEEVL